MPTPPTTPAEKSSTQDRRSPCPVACSLDLLGDRWTLLVIRDLFLGRSRFKDFMASPEGIPTNILTERLRRLKQSGIVEQVSANGSKHLAYQLTPMGKELLPTLAAMKAWGLKWLPDTEARLQGVAISPGPGGPAEM